MSSSPLGSTPLSLEEFAVEEQINHKLAGWFAGCMGVIMLAFAIFRWTRFFYLRLSKNSRNSAVLHAFVSGTR